MVLMKVCGDTSDTEMKNPEHKGKRKDVIRRKRESIEMITRDFIHMILNLISQKSKINRLTN